MSDDNLVNLDDERKKITAERVNEICDIMRVGEWVRGVTGEEFVKRWNLSLPRINQLAAEAWRRVCAESNDPEKMRPEIAGILRKNLNKADQKSNFRAIASLAETYTKVIGARAPERHEHAVVIAQFDSLPRAGKLRWIDERIAKLQEAREALETMKDE